MKFDLFISVFALAVALESDQPQNLQSTYHSKYTPSYHSTYNYPKTTYTTYVYTYTKPAYTPSYYVAPAFNVYVAPVYNVYVAPINYYNYNYYAPSYHYTYVRTPDCPYGCSINGVCASESQCSTSIGFGIGIGFVLLVVCILTVVSWFRKRGR